MIEMTLHAVTVRCESLPEALSLLDRWARMGEITLPPAPREPAVREVTTTTTFAAPPDLLPRVPRPAAPPKHKPSLEKACAVCRTTFTAASPRTITCDRHRMKPGQKLADIQKVYAREQSAKAPAKAPVDRAAAKGLLARPPIKPNEPTKPCSACGDKARETELDTKGRCRDCQPIGGKA